MHARRRHEAMRHGAMMVRRATLWLRLPAAEQLEIDDRLPWKDFRVKRGEAEK